MNDLRKQLNALLRLVSATEVDEIDCDEFLKRAATLLESLVPGQEPPDELAIVSQHLSVCPECREEFDALVRATDAGNEQ